MKVRIRRKLKGMDILSKEWDLLIELGDMVDIGLGINHFTESSERQFFKARVLFILVAKELDISSKSLSEYFRCTTSGIRHHAAQSHYITEDRILNDLYIYIYENLRNSENRPIVNLNLISKTFNKDQEPKEDLNPSIRQSRLLSNIENELFFRMGSDPLLKARVTKYTEVKIAFCLLVKGLDLQSGVVATFLNITRASVNNYLNSYSIIEENQKINKIYIDILQTFNLAYNDKERAIFILSEENARLKEKIELMESARAVPFEQQIKQLNPEQLNNLTIRLEAFFKMLK